MREELQLIPRMTRAPEPTLRDLAAVFFRQRRLILLWFGGILVAVLVYGLIAPSYESEMRVLVRRGRADPPVTSATEPPQLERDDVTEEELNSEAELLHDNEILTSVVRASGLEKDSSWFRRLRGETAAQHLQRAVRKLDRRLDVQAAKKTTLITVSYASADPEQAARVLRCLADAYLARHLQVRRPSGELNFFEQQIGESRRALEQAELNLMNFTRDEGVISAAQERDIALQKISEMESGQRQTQVEMAETSQRIRILRSKLAALPERVTTLVQNSDNPQLFEKLKSSLLDLELRRTELLTKYEPAYRLVQEVDRQIAQAKDSIAHEELAPLREQTTDLDPNHTWAKGELVKAEVELGGLEARSKAAAAVLSKYQQNAQELGVRALKQEDLLSALKAEEDQYLLYMQKREQARIGDALDQERILNVTIAEQPTVPALPARSELTYGLLGFGLAAVASTVIGFAADRLDPAFRTPDEVLAYLGTPVLASLPRHSE